jgi:hypothetical protein
MSQTSDQQELDYTQAAQYRVAADTLALVKQATLTAPAGAASVTLPSDVLRLLAVATSDGSLLNPTTIREFLSIKTLEATEQGPSNSLFVVVGRDLMLWPTPGTDLTLTITYSYRPAAITSASTLEVTGLGARLVERLAASYSLLDDGQPELAQSELGDYQKDASRLKRIERRREGQGGRISTVRGTRRR